jgi:hypothetical protein
MGTGMEPDEPSRWAPPAPGLLDVVGLALLALASAWLLSDHVRREQVVSRKWWGSQKELSLGSLSTTSPESPKKSNTEPAGSVSTSLMRMLAMLVLFQLLCIADGARVTESGGAGSVAGAGGTERKALEGVASIAVSGLCAGQSSSNGVYEPIAFTKSGRPWYRNGNGKALYWDLDCDGGTGGYARWIIDSDEPEPSVTAESDLDGEWREVVEERK